MRLHGLALPIILGVALSGAACSNPEKGVIDRYFAAVNQNDTQTLSSFAAVSFNKKVQSWEITSASPESKAPAPLPDLVKKEKDIETELNANKKAANTYALDHYAEIDQVKELRKQNKPIPAKLSAAAVEWDKFNQKDRELKKALADAKAAVERELRAVQMSVGQVQNVETLPGEQVSKQVNLNLTIDGQPQKYTMILKKYEIKPDTGGRVISRWIVAGLQPAAG